jgi:tetratricopeptide (TPR) repeat protein
MERPKYGGTVVAEWAIPLAKTAGPSAGKLVAKPLKGVYLPWSVAFTTRRQAKKKHLGVLPYWKLRKYLSTGAALEAFKTGDPERYEEVGRALQALCQNSESENEADAECPLAVLLLESYTASLDPNTNVAMYSAITAERVVSKVEERDSTRHAGDATFEQNLELIPPHRAEEARGMRSAWPAISLFVHEFVHSSDRTSALVSWHNNPPTWFQGRPSGAIVWFANLANDYGLREIASAAFGEAIDAGATPESEWRTRQILGTSQDAAELTELLAPYASEDPIASAISTANTESYAAAAIKLRDWEPQSLSDKARKIALLSQLVSVDDIAEAIALSERGSTEYRSATCYVLLARFLVIRGSSRSTTLDFADLERALEAALTARDLIRAWEGPSEEAAEVAIVAARLLGRTQQAWRLACVAPEGTATSREAANLGVRREAAAMAAQVKTPALARELALGTGLRTEHEVEALIALFNRDDEVALAQFQSAIEHAVEPREVEQLSLQVALLGSHSSKLEQLGADRQAELKLIAEAKNGSEEAISILRARARSSRILARVLIGFAIDADDARGAAVQAEQSGRHWSDADFLLLAAELYIELKEFDSAVECAEEALRLGSPAWEGALRAHNVTIQALTVRGMWAPAVNVAMDVLAKEPENLSAVWVLTLCQYHLGRFEQAWKSYTEVGNRPAPRDEQEALVRLDLWRRFERNASNLDTLDSLLEQFPESRAVKASVVGSLLGIPLDDDDSEMAERIRGIIAPLLEQLPDVFVQQEIDENNPLESIRELLRDEPDTSEQDARLEEGRFPIGMAATLHRRSLTEMLAIRTRAPLFAGDTETFEAEVSTATAAMGFGVVVDLTALYAISVMNESLSDLLLGRFIELTAARAQLIDSIQGCDRLAGLATLQIGLAADGSAVAVTISIEEAEARYERAQRIRAQFEKVTTNDTVDIANFPEISSDGAGVAFAWISALDTAIGVGHPLWCDDRTTRRLAAEKGVNTFGTQALIEALRRGGTITDEMAVAHQADLVARYFVGLSFRRDVLTHAANIDGWNSRGCAAFIAHSAPIPDAGPLIAFVMEAVRRNINDPDSMRGWIAAGALWVVRVAPSAQAAQGNLESLLSMLLQQSWLESSKLPFVLQGIRDGIGTKEIRDPLKDAMEKHYRFLAQQSSWAQAAQWIRELFALANREDRIIATGVVFQVR